jgi:hypothetical protein
MMMTDLNLSPPQEDDNTLPEDNGQEAKSWSGRTFANSRCQTKFWEC